MTVIVLITTQFSMSTFSTCIEDTSIYKNKTYIYLYLSIYIYIYKGKKRKCKAVLLQAGSGPEGSRKLRFPDFMTTAQDGGKVVSLTH